MKIIDLLVPNRKVNGKITQMIVYVWVILFGVIWTFSPFQFLPKPNEVYTALADLWTYYNLGVELFTSFKVNLEAIFIGTILSLILSYLNTIQIFKPVISVFGKLRFLSMVGLSFFFILNTVNGHQLKVSMLVFSISVFFVTGMVDVIQAIPQEQYDLAKTLKMNEWQTLWEVVILGQADKAFDVLRQNAAIGFMMLTMVESMSMESGGIGVLLITQQKYFHMAAIIGMQLTILVIGLGQDFAISFFRRLICPYADLERERK